MVLNINPTQHITYSILGELNLIDSSTKQKYEEHLSSQHQEIIKNLKKEIDLFPERDLVQKIRLVKQTLIQQIEDMHLAYWN